MTLPLLSCINSVCKTSAKGTFTTTDALLLSTVLPLYMAGNCLLVNMLTIFADVSPSVMRSPSSLLKLVAVVAEVCSTSTSISSRFKYSLYNSLSVKTFFIFPYDLPLNTVRLAV